MASWSDGPSAEIVLRQIGCVTELTSDGRIKLLDMSVYESAYSILGTLLRTNPDIPEVEREKAIRAAVTGCIRSHTLTPNDVITAVSASEREYLKQPLTQFVLLSTISIKHHGAPLRLRFQGSTITLSTRIPKRFVRPESVSENVHFGPPPTGYATVQVTTLARCPHSAVKVSMERLDLLRGLWNLSMNFQSWRRSGPRSEPVNALVLGPVHTIHSPDGSPASDTYWWEPSYVLPIRPTDISERLPSLRRTERWALRKVAAAKYADRLRDCIVRYCRALDERDLNNAFVRLWGVLEDLTGVGENESHIVAVRRATGFLDNVEYERTALHRLRHWRNRMVHSGEGTGRAELLTYDLKWYVETLLRVCLSHTKRLRTWDEYCQFLEMPADAATLERRIRIAKLAHRMRPSIRAAV